MRSLCPTVASSSDVVSPRLGDRLAPARHCENARLFTKPENLIEIRAHLFDDLIVRKIDGFGPAHTAGNALQQLAAARRPRWKELTHVQAAEQLDVGAARHEESEPLDFLAQRARVDAEGHTDDRRVLDRREFIGQVRTHAAQDLGGLVGGYGEHDPCRAHAVLTSRSRRPHQPAITVTPNRGHPVFERNGFDQPLGEGTRERSQSLHRRVAAPQPAPASAAKEPGNRPANDRSAFPLHFDE